MSGLDNIWHAVDRLTESGIGSSWARPAAMNSSHVPVTPTVMTAAWARDPHLDADDVGGLAGGLCHQGAHGRHAWSWKPTGPPEPRQVTAGQASQEQSG